MGCCSQCDGLEQMFDRRNADHDLHNYLRRGPDKSTRILIDALRASGVEGATLLDIGGGIGAIHHELLTGGVAHATDVDVSRAYIQVAKEEDARRGQSERVDYRLGDFVALADEIEPADIVTLDRVICCYHDMPALVERSAQRAHKVYGLVFPREHGSMRVGRAIINLWSRIQRSPYRFFLHRAEDVDSILRANGFERRFVRQTFAWNVVVYGRNEV